MDQAREKKGRPAVRLSLLGDGLLERARSTSFALLGLVTAVCLGIVALTVNQDWPSIADSPIPALPSPAADDPETARRGDSGAARPPQAARPVARIPVPNAAAERRAGVASPITVQSKPPQQSVSTSAPSGGGRNGGGSEGPAAKPSPVPVAQPVPRPATQPAPAPDEPPATPPPPPAQPAPEPSPPVATAGPPGNGNAYGWENGKAKGHSR